MTFWTLIVRRLRFHARAHFGVVLGAAVGRPEVIGVLGVDGRFWELANNQRGLTSLPAGTAGLNEALAAQLKVKAGDSILLRVEKPSAISRDAPISPQQDVSAALRVKVHAIIPDEQLGRFSLQANQVAPFNAFVNMAELQKEVAQPGRANLLLEQGKLAAANQSLTQHFQLADA